MNQDEIIEMAREVGLVIDGNQSGLDDLQAFAHLVAAKEREACALICDDHHEIWRFGEGEYLASGPKDCAAVIRARGEA